MCGIAGIAHRDGGGVSPPDLARMCGTMVRRGPDEEALFIDKGIGLGLRRLSIIGLEKGRQPVHNEDGSVVVVMNGEIYNYRELREDLETRGHHFATDTDTETIAHLYEERGEECVTALRGMFAFAVWDKRQHKLFLARDRIGIKPLYYGEIGHRFVFASELKAILALPEVSRELNWRSLDHLFTTMTTPATESIVAGIHKLEPAHTLVWSRGGGLRKRRYWRARFDPDYRRSEQDTIAELYARLEESVKLHRVSDVPVGALLSGGVDSSAVVAVMARLSGRPVKTFSIGFSERSHDESAYARKVASYLGTEHHELILEPDLVTTMEDFAWHMDEPFGDVSALPTFAVSRLAARHLKVAQSGDGGDELFAGYDRYLVEARERRRDSIPGTIRSVLGGVGHLMPEGMKGRNFLRHIALSGMERCRDSGVLLRDDSRRKLFRPEILEQIAAQCNGKEQIWPELQPGADWLSQLQRQDLESYLPLDVLTKVDRMSMANSLEVRVPLLDHKFVEFAATIPSEWRLHENETKYIFKKTLRGLLPDDILYRRKQGFAVPIGTWFRTHLGAMINDLLLSDTSMSARFVNRDYVRRIMALHERGRGMDLQLWTLVSFELWCRQFLDDRHVVPGQGSNCPEPAGLLASQT